jgi:predicted 3-demethylubiquinone-9 3-methyltransferase (glyoxalase superfamily)
MNIMINCKDQDEVDHFWNRFVGDGGKEIDCGWCNDKFGVFWQVVPVEMMHYLGDPDPERSGKAFAAMMTMKKIDINAIKAAVEA